MGGAPTHIYPALRDSNIFLLLRRPLSSFFYFEAGRSIPSYLKSSKTRRNFFSATRPSLCPRRRNDNGWEIGTNFASTSMAFHASVRMKRKDTFYALINTITRHEEELTVLLADLSLLDDYKHILILNSWQLDDAFSELVGHQHYQTLETRVRMAREEYGDTLPEGHLNAVETRLYVSLYGEPNIHEQKPGSKRQIEPDQLCGDGKGGFQEVDFDRFATDELGIAAVYGRDNDLPGNEISTLKRVQEVAEQLGGELSMEQSALDTDPTPRLHPLTLAGKFSTNPSTIFFPKETFTGPISDILSNFSNKHIADATRRCFGGPWLPHSTTTAPPRAKVPQLPIPLNASQHHMGEMEANAYIAALYPGIYASVTSVLVEVRKRLGVDWIRNLITKDGGPGVLDAGGCGAGILAWRDVLRAEWELMVPNHPREAMIPLGKSTVLTGSDALRRRASLMLENTTFLPRLPDYIHVRDAATLDDDRVPPKRKQYDVVIAPHTMLQIEEDYLRKQHVKNLWSLLNPDGGVLILIEKGRQNGFEAIAGAREMLLEHYISSPESTKCHGSTESGDDGVVSKEPGMIIAPCTNHKRCPMYLFSGSSEGRRDYCRFKQRYIRPQFLQRIISARDHNHEDVEFSYIAIQRGIDTRKTQRIVQGHEATDAAFAGYEDLFNEENAGEQMATTFQANFSRNISSSETSFPFNPLALPRAILPPLKRRGHVIFDFCTPAGKIERWTVPRSFSPRAYRDARKAHWGDLWALGAKTRIPRGLSLGEQRSKSRERLKARAAAKASQLEELDDPNLLTEQGDEVPLNLSSDSISTNHYGPLTNIKKYQTIPSWKKHNDKKRIRQATKKRFSAQSNNKPNDKSEESS